MDKIPFTVYDRGHRITGYFRPDDTAEPPRNYAIYLGEYYIAHLVNRDGKWHMGGIWGDVLGELIGDYIMAWYQ